MGCFFTAKDAKVRKVSLFSFPSRTFASLAVNYFPINPVVGELGLAE